MKSDQSLWVFAYGSLMWDPGFEYEERRVARLYGYHRALCIYAWTYRGSRKNPGLVVGLDAGGSCVGRAYRVKPSMRDQVIEYLDARETPDIEDSDLSIDVYRKKWATVRLADNGPDIKKVNAICYVADRRHPQYACDPDIEKQIKCILEGRGNRGTSLDYLANTIQHLDELGIADGPLHQIWQRVLEHKENVN